MSSFRYRFRYWKASSWADIRHWWVDRSRVPEPSPQTKMTGRRLLRRLWWHTGLPQFLDKRRWGRWLVAKFMAPEQFENFVDTTGPILSDWMLDDQFSLNRDVRATSKLPIPIVLLSVTAEADPTFLPDPQADEKAIAAANHFYQEKGLVND